MKWSNRNTMVWAMIDRIPGRRQTTQGPKMDLTNGGSMTLFRKKEDDAMPPTKLAHVVYQTNRMADMRDWYASVLGGRVIYENDRLCFVTYDDEHHRVAFADFAPLTPRDPAAGTELGVRPGDQPGLHHVAFTFASLGELLDNYARLKSLGILPFFCVNHGPTTSMYYRDPDGNRVELQIDKFATAEEGQAWMHSAAFDRNPIGVEYDPEELIKKFRSGVPVAELVVRGDEA